MVVDKGGGYYGGGFGVPPVSVGNAETLLAKIAGALVAAAFAVADSIAKPTQTEEDAYSVYFLKETGDINNEIVYVGRVKTSNFSTRMSYHKQRNRELVYHIDGLNYKECRFVEQAGMIWCHTISSDPLNNQIRGISPTNPNRFEYFDAGASLAENGSWLEGVFPISYWANQTENMLLNGTP